MLDINMSPPSCTEGGLAIALKPEGDRAQDWLMGVYSLQLHHLISGFGACSVRMGGQDLLLSSVSGSTMEAAQ